MFHPKEKNGIKYFSSNSVSLKHAFSTKGIDARNEKDRKIFCDELGFDFEKLIMPSQEHTNNIAIIKNQKNLHQDLSATDGVIISIKDIPVMLVFADCVPIMIYSESKQVVALLHSGWKGTSLKIVSKALSLMEEQFEVQASQAKALIGAAIGDCCYEVNDDVSMKLQSSLVGDYQDIIVDNKANLQKINEYQMRESGIVDIDIMDYCTSCDNHLFYSYRKNNKTPKRHAMVAVL